MHSKNISSKLPSRADAQRARQNDPLRSEMENAAEGRKMFSHENLVAKFWNRVKKTDSCWLWVGARKQGGYGYLHLDRGRDSRKQMMAHRFSYELHFGALGNLCCCHHCDNPNCVNPAHLFAGTHQDNMADAYAKGRLTGPLGERARSAKLQRADIVRIRELLASGISQSKIGAAYGVSQPSISAIKLGEHWSHV